MQSMHRTTANTPCEVPARPCRANAQVGLLNLGNTCYINTLLQCLYCCKYLRKFLTKYSHETSDLYTSLKTLFANMAECTTHVISPRPFLITASKYLEKSMFLYEQNDITEFYSLLVDKLNISISHTAPELTALQFMDRINYNATQTSYNKLRFKMEMKWYNHMRKEMSKICPFMYGQTITQIECGHCGKTHHNGELFTSLALPIPTAPPDTSKATTLAQSQPPSMPLALTLLDCIAKHFEQHTVNNPTEEDKWTCDACKQQAQSTQLSYIWKAPPILALSLKRFAFTPRPIKHNDPIHAPDTMDLSTYILSRESSTKYRLRAVAMHFGSFFGGHYVAMVNQKEKWYVVDDDSVCEVDNPIDIIATKGYMFFYERVGL